MDQNLGRAYAANNFANNFRGRVGYWGDARHHFLVIFFMISDKISCRYEEVDIEQYDNTSNWTPRYRATSQCQYGSGTA